MVAVGARGSTSAARRAGEDGWIEWLVALSAGAFIVILQLASVFDRSILLLHILQALIYVAVIVLTKRHSAWGYGAGCIIAAFWNYVNLFHTTFISAGVEQLTVLVQTGNLARPDLLIGVFAGAVHLALIVACLAGYVRLRNRSVSDVLKFWCGGALAVGYFVMIIVLTGPQYLPLVRDVFGLDS